MIEWELWQYGKKGYIGFRPIRHENIPFNAEACIGFKKWVPMWLAKRILKLFFNGSWAWTS